MIRSNYLREKNWYQLQLNEMSIFVLRLIDRVRALDNQYKLMRFFGKAEMLPDEIFKTLDYLVKNNFLEVTKIVYTVKYYQLTYQGKIALEENYKSETMRNYVNTIDTTGYYENYLSLIENAD